MEPRNVLLQVTGIQRYENARPETITLTTDGLLWEQDGVLYLQYEESELTGLEGTTTFFQLEGERIRLIRTGRVNSRMEFVLGRVDQSLYDTGFGAVLLTIRTTQMECHMDARGGNFRVAYKITIEEMGSGEIEYRVEVTPQ